MPYIKLLTALTALVLLTACGGGGAATGDSSQTTDCKANPFGASCIAEDIALPARITDCITGGNAGDAKCASLTSDAAMNTAINTCLTNPFDDSCTASDFTFSTYADMARTNRVSFCETAGNETNALCSADSGYADCIANPFATGCGAYFESAKNPYCETNPTEAPCVNTADLPTYPTTPNTTTRKNEFLQATTTGFASGATDGLMIPSNPTPSAVEIVTVKFADADTATGGAAFFEGGVYNNGARVGTGRFFYAGILDGTDLGAPITETITKAVTWTGQIRAVSTSSNGTLEGASNNTFELNITFDGTRETKGTMNTIYAEAQFAYEIDGTFDENGIITGKVNYGAGNADNFNPTMHSNFYSPGTLTGIIGQNGAVGVFHSDNANSEAGSSAFIFSGGFVVGPPIANYATWLANARNSDNSAALTIPTVALAMDTPNPYGFITAGATELNLTDATQKNAVNLGELSGSNNNTSGFAIGQIGTETSIRRHIGILDGTNVGTPLPLEASITAEWTGLLAIETEQFSKKPIILNVGFDGTTGTIKTQTGGFEYHTTTGDAAPNIAIDGKFGTNGVIYGTTTGTNINIFAPVTITGTLTGLIGEDGAVAVFAGNAGNGGYGYGGGFVARPNPSTP